MLNYLPEVFGVNPISTLTSSFPDDASTKTVGNMWYRKTQSATVIAVGVHCKLCCWSSMSMNSCAIITQAVSDPSPDGDT